MAETEATKSEQTIPRSGTPSPVNIVGAPFDVEKHPTEKPAPPPEPAHHAHPHHFPEGGLKAWLTVLGGFFSMFCSFGWANAIGVFQDYYETHQLKHLSSSAVGWISSLQLFFMFGCGIFVGRLFDAIGPRYLLITGTVLEVLGLMMTSICTKYGEFLVCQGIIAPIGAAFIFYTGIAAVPTHFHKKRGVAMGISSSGSSLGGTLFPIMVKKLSQRVSYGWTMRSCAFLILGLLIVANLTITSNAEHKGLQKIHPRDITKHFREIHYVLLVVSFLLTFWGLFIPFDYLTTTARHYDISDDMATYLVSILNAASVISRIVTGHIADHAGRFNVNSIGILTAGILTLALWIPSTGLAPFIVYAIIYGFASGTFISLGPACCAQISQVSDIGTRVGALFAVGSFAALTGIPIAGAIIGDGSDQARWRGMMAFAGSLILLGGALHWWGRVLKVGWSLRKVF
ncbi:major facilitator superfamily domain-containing protein [Lipomyces tetrasporus]